MSELKKLEKQDIKTICRICLNKSHVLILLENHIYGENDLNSPPIYDVLTQLTSLEIENDHPKGICLKCFDLVKVAYNLKVQCERSWEILKGYKSETFPEKENDKDDPDLEIVDFTDENSSKLEIKEEIYFEDSLLDSHQELDENKEHESKQEESSEINNINNKETTNIIQIKNTDDIQVRCIDINKFIIEKKSKPVEYDFNYTDTKISKECEQLAAEELNKSKLLKIKCPICLKFYTKGKLRQHIVYCQELNVTSLTCKVCNKVFKKVKDLNYHVKINHSNNPPICPCKICGYHCKNRSALQLHVRQKHGEKKVVCEICGKKFFNNANLLRHISKHTKETQEVCNVCGKTFHYKGALFYHMKIHTNERKYLCNFCDKKFYTSQSMQRHIDIHINVKRCKCSFCEKHFRSASERKRHERIHTGERPHVCEYCKKGFNSKYNHDIHVSTHKGHIPCNMCKGKYLNEKVLELHVKLKHKCKTEESCNK